MINEGLIFKSSELAVQGKMSDSGCTIKLQPCDFLNQLNFYKNKGSFANRGLIFNVFEHSFDENCPIAVINASHFLPCHFFSNSQRDHSAESKFSKNMSK